MVVHHSSLCRNDSFIMKSDLISFDETSPSAVGAQYIQYDICSPQFNAVYMSFEIIFEFLT